MEIDSVIKNPLTKKILGWVAFTSEFYQTFKEKLTSVFLKSSKNLERALSYLFNDVSINLTAKPEKDTRKL